MTKPPTTNIGLRIPVTVQQRIDAAAQRAGVTRTEYILSWLPAYYERSAEPAADKAEQRQRVSQRARKRSPTREK